MPKLRSHSVDKSAMRGVWSVTLLVLFATAGCADAGRFMPKLRAVLHESQPTSRASSPAPSLAGSAGAASTQQQLSANQIAAAQTSTAPEPLASGAIDMSNVLRDAVRLPQDVQRVREAIVTALIIISVLGFANILLMLAVLSSLRRVAGKAGDTQTLVAALPPSPIDAGLTAFAGADPSPVAPPTLVYRPTNAATPAMRTCACGAEISARSKTGRCRACARTATSRAKRVARTSDAPART